MNMNLSLNQQITQVKESATLEINQRVRVLKSQDKSVVHFGFGESPFPVPIQLQDRLIQFSDIKTYLPAEGLPDLRHAIASYYTKNYDYSFSSNDVFIAPGSKESLFHLLYLLDGDLLLPSPSWVSYEPQAKLLDKQVYRMQTDINNSYCLAALELEDVCQSLQSGKQKILILNSPNNPTGCCYTQQNFHELAAICRKNNIVVISDEIYAGTECHDCRHASMVYAYPEGTIVTSGLSKYFSAGGYRLGFCLVPESMNELQKSLKVLISETYSCVSAPIQYAGVAAYTYDNSVKEHVEDCAELHRLAGQYLYHEFIQMGLNCAKPNGAFYLMPDFANFKTKLKQQGITSDKQLALTLLEDYGVATLPGIRVRHATRCLFPANRKC